MSLETATHLAMSILMLVYGIGAWAQQRKSGESTNATDITRALEKVRELETAVLSKASWKELDREGKAIRREIELQDKAMCERVERLEAVVERRQWN